MNRDFYSRVIFYCWPLLAVTVLVSYFHFVPSSEKSAETLGNHSTQRDFSSNLFSASRYPSQLLKRSKNISPVSLDFGPPPLALPSSENESSVELSELTSPSAPAIVPLPALSSDENTGSESVPKALPVSEQHWQADSHHENEVAASPFFSSEENTDQESLDASQPDISTTQGEQEEPFWSRYSEKDAAQSNLSMETTLLERLPETDITEAHTEQATVAASPHTEPFPDIELLPETEIERRPSVFSRVDSEPLAQKPFEAIPQDDDQALNIGPELAPESHTADNFAPAGSSTDLDASWKELPQEPYQQPPEPLDFQNPDYSTAPVELPAVAAEQIQHRPALNGSAMEAVSQRADALTRHSFTLASRGAHYSARAELIQALRLITQALDAENGTNAHSQALSQGFRALSEADDFVPRGTDLEADLDMNNLIASHRTPVLKGSDNTHLIPLVALQRYYTYAQEQLTLAGGRQPAASMVLYGLARLQSELIAGVVDNKKLGGPKAMTLHQAALLVDSNNYRAANELGVLLARYGQFEESQKVLVHSISLSSQPQTWFNLAIVHEHLGQHDLARRARYEQQLATEKLQQAQQNGRRNDESIVRWVDNDVFANQASSPELHLRSNQPAQPRQKRRDTKKQHNTAKWLPWFRQQR